MSVLNKADKKVMKINAWHCKKFAVMIKKKMHRKQHSRNERFRELVAILHGPGDED